MAFLDNAATSQKPSSVIDAISHYYRESNSNVHRGVYELAEDAENLYHHSRKVIANTLTYPKEKRYLSEVQLKA